MATSWRAGRTAPPLDAILHACSRPARARRAAEPAILCAHALKRAMAAIVLITGATGGWSPGRGCAARGWSLCLPTWPRPRAMRPGGAFFSLQREFGVDVAWRACDLTAPADRDALGYLAPGRAPVDAAQRGRPRYQGLAERARQALTVARLHVRRSSQLPPRPGRATPDAAHRQRACRLLPSPARPSMPPPSAAWSTSRARCTSSCARATSP